MAQVNIANYVEGNKTFVNSASAKQVGNETLLGDQEGQGQVNVDINRVYSAGVFVGFDGHKN